MKNYFFLLFLTFLLSNCSFLKIKTKRKSIDGNSFEKRIEDIKKATVIVNKLKGVSKGFSGSGTLILDPFFGHYILTNAHVCLEDLPFFLNDEKYEKEFLKKTSSYKITGHNNDIVIQVKNSNLSYLLDADLCRIPLDPMKFDNSFHFLSKKSNIKIKDKKELILFTRKKNKEISTRKGLEIDSDETYNDYKIKSRISKKKYEVLTGPYAYTSINIVPGDSGSLIYDQNLNIYGLVFGFSVKDPEVLAKGRKKKKKNREDFSFFKEFLSHYGLEKKDLKDGKIKMTDLNGMFIKLKDLLSD